MTASPMNKTSPASRDQAAIPANGYSWRYIVDIALEHRHTLVGASGGGESTQTLA